MVSGRKDEDGACELVGEAEYAVFVFLSMPA